MDARRSGALLLLSGAVFGGVLGVAVVLATAPRTPSTEYLGSYAPVSAPTASAYSSRLTVTVSSNGPQWLPSLPIAVGVGAALALLGFVALVGAGRRLVLVRA